MSWAGMVRTWTSKGCSWSELHHWWGCTAPEMTQECHRNNQGVSSNTSSPGIADNVHLTTLFLNFVTIVHLLSSYSDSNQPHRDWGCSAWILLKDNNTKMPLNRCLCSSSAACAHPKSPLKPIRITKHCWEILLRLQFSFWTSGHWKPGWQLHPAPLVGADTAHPDPSQGWVQSHLEVGDKKTQHWQFPGHPKFGKTWLWK